ncbi:hypothetical protein DB30_02754 [Enhygromyxa salina]|uniref:B12-binding domain-containing protein n=1 Tax=Enhygromyxa salina TaxID=215803 RepID=A0A0C2A7G6_9BACT|nr:cobalamin-dependent protein [Enhygromyxa salina]KIG19473.1 hypothetical protein DB30_02754 [Enhygromyxa salina]
MNTASLHARAALAARLLTHKRSVSEEVTDEFFRLHPDWLVRYGERGRMRGVDDAGFHIDFLAGAIEAGAAGPFEDYARWTVRMLGARGIAAAFVMENFEQIERALARRLWDQDERGMLAYIVAAAIRACEVDSATPTGAAPDIALASTRSTFVQAILAGQRRAACTIALEAVRAGIGMLDLYSDVIQEALYEVGRLWESNAIAVAQEHMATATVQRVLAEVYAEMPPNDAKRGTALLTGVVGELHQVGANMIADALEADGWSVRFLGTNMPHAGIIEIFEEKPADLVGISCTMSFNLPSVVDLVQQIAALDPRPKLVLGGAAFRSAPSLVDELESDGFAPDVRSAVHMARSLGQAS